MRYGSLRSHAFAGTTKQRNAPHRVISSAITLQLEKLLFRCPPANAGAHNHGAWIEVPKSHQQIAEIAPFEIVPLDELDLPIPFPALELLLAGDGFFGAVVRFHVDETIDAIRPHK